MKKSLLFRILLMGLIIGCIFNVDYSICFGGELSKYEILVINFENDTMYNMTIDEDLEPYAYHNDDNSFVGKGNYSVRDIIGSDDRIPIQDNATGYYPSSAIGMIRSYFSDGKVTRGTGFLVGKNDIVTAGHCFWDKDASRHAISSEFIIGGRTYPIKNIAISNKYTVDLDVDNYDYAVCEIGIDLGNTRGIIPISYENPGDMTFSVTGFPDDTMGLPKIPMCVSFGKKVYMNDLSMLHNADTKPGMSGGPIVLGTFMEKNVRCIGIHIQGRKDFGEGEKVEDTELAYQFNRGVRCHKEFVSLVSGHVKN